MKIKNILGFVNTLPLFKRYEAVELAPQAEKELDHILDLTKEGQDHYKSIKLLGFDLTVTGDEVLLPLREAEEIHLFGGVVTTTQVQVVIEKQEEPTIDNSLINDEPSTQASSEPEELVDAPTSEPIDLESILKEKTLDELKAIGETIGVTIRARKADKAIAELLAHSDEVIKAL
jgi:hypothetical protein